jgi:hypothetical protein
MVKKVVSGRGKQGKRMRGGLSAANGNVVNGQGNQGNGRDTNSVLSEVYDGAATFGQFMALLALIVGSIVSSILLLVSLYLLTRTSNYKSTSATVVSVTSCSNVSSSSYEKNQESIQCQVAFKYTVDSKEYTNTITTGPQNVGSTVTLRYDVKNPNNVTNNLISKDILGWILFGFAILIIAGVSLNYYIAQRFKFAAAGNGVTSLF